MEVITITKKDFIAAIDSANEKFNRIAEEKSEDKNPLHLLMMTLQNMMFGHMIADELFGKNEQDTKED